MSTPGLSPAEQSFISPHLKHIWASKGVDQSQWAKACNQAANELAQRILAMRSGTIPMPEHPSLELYKEAARKREQIAHRIGQAMDFGELRTDKEPLYTIMSDSGTYGSQFEKIKHAITALADKNGIEAAHGLSWKVTKENKSGLEITTVQLIDGDEKIMQTLQTLKVLETEKTLGDYTSQLNAQQHPEWHEVLTRSKIREELSVKKEAALIIHTPGQHVEAMLHRADNALAQAIQGQGNIEHAIGNAAWVLGIAAPLRRGSASTSDILIKALMKANNMEVKPYRADTLNWDLAAIVAPSQEEFAKYHALLFEGSTPAADRQWSIDPRNQPGPRPDRKLD